MRFPRVGPLCILSPRLTIDDHSSALHTLGAGRNIHHDSQRTAGRSSEACSRNSSEARSSGERNRLARSRIHMVSNHSLRSSPARSRNHMRGLKVWHPRSKQPQFRLQPSNRNIELRLCRRRQLW